VEQGYVRRERQAGDARRVDLWLTSKGDVEMRRSSVLEEARVQAVLEELRPTERALAVEGLRLLAQASRRFMQRQDPRSEETAQGTSPALRKAKR
jgi:DNA-binding MarR family transcriptional regulator